MKNDVTCSVTLLVLKKYEEAMSDEHPQYLGVQLLLDLTGSYK